MQNSLTGRKIAILVANGFHEHHMTEAQRALIQTGARVTVVSLKSGLINSWKDGEWGLNFTVDAPLSMVLAADFDMLYVPGGQRSIDKLSESAHTSRIIRGFMDARKPVAMQGEALELLTRADRPVAENVISDKDLTDQTAFIQQMLDSFVASQNNSMTPHLEAA